MPKSEQHYLEDKKRLEYERYYQTVNLTLGIKHYLDKNDNGVRFVSAEAVLKCIENNNPINPDFVLQYDGDKKGILGEIKTSIPYKEQYYEEDVEQLKKYCKTVEGWDTPNKLVEQHDVLCLVYTDDSDRFVEIIRERNSDEDIFKQKMTISEFSKITSFKIGEGDVFLIKFKYGSLGCIKFLEELKENIKIRIDELQENYEVCKFTRKEPPIEYFLDHIWLQVFPFFAPPAYEDQIFEIKISDVFDTIEKYYISWSGIEGEYSQIRKKWLKKAMETLVLIKLAEIVDEKNEIYRINYDKKTPKDIKDYLIQEMAKKEVSKNKKAKPAKGQIKLFQTE